MLTHPTCSNANNFTQAQLPNITSNSTNSVPLSFATSQKLTSVYYGYITFGIDGDGVYDFQYLLLDFVLGQGKVRYKGAHIWIAMHIG